MPVLNIWAQNNLEKKGGSNEGGDVTTERD